MNAQSSAEIDERDPVAWALAIQAEYERAEAADDEFRQDNVRSLASARETAALMPAAGPPVIEMFMDDDRIVFRDQAALDQYVREALEARRA